MAIFAQPTPDMNLVPGWDVQGIGSASNPGPDAPGYGQPGNTGTTLTSGQPGAGLPNPPGAENVSGETSGSYGVPILSNPGYADATGPGGRALPATIGGTSYSLPGIPASGALATNPTPFVATVVIAGGTVTAVKVGAAGQTFAQATQVGTGDGTYAVPPGGVIGMTWSATPTSMTWSV